MVSNEIAIPIAGGALVILFSLLRIRSILRLLEDNRYRQYWRTVAILVGLFLVGYAAAIGVVLVDDEQTFQALASMVFLMGALFVFLVSHAGYITYEELVRSRKEVEEREEEVEWLYQVMDVLNRILRHNLRNNMNVIIGLSELIRQSADAGEEDHAQAIKEEAQNLVEMGDKAREIHQTVLRDVEKRPMNLGHLLSQEAESVQGTFPDGEIHLDVDEQWVHAGPLLDTAVENVLDNALRHNDSETPSVEVTVAESDGEVTVEFTDNGPGIPGDELEVIRENRETPLQHGSGLGLWLVNWIVEQYDGSLVFGNSDGGTTVRITLPAAERPDDAARPVAAAE